MNKKLSIIVASSLEYGIGFENELCWNIPDELKYFRHITTSCLRQNTKNCVIMGKNTWYSLPKAPLKDRINVIISSNDYEKIKNELATARIAEEDARVFKTIDDALIYVNSNDIIENAFIIGGAQLYNTFLEKHINDIKSIYWSIIYDKHYHCDRFISSNVIYNNFSFLKEDIVINDRYISMYGVNKNNINHIADEPPD
jgi:dihydrofolate reductase